MSSNQIYPRGTGRAPTPKEVPKGLKEDYEEACLVLPLSAKASAALARRCLQNLLKEQGYSGDLVNQIGAILNEEDPTKSLPASLNQTIDAIRNFGNFSAHPLTDKTTLQIIDVDPHEAEWCLEILEELFEHYYVKPAIATAKKAALDKKLKKAGKPPAK